MAIVDELITALKTGNLWAVQSGRPFFGSPIAAFFQWRPDLRFASVHRQCTPAPGLAEIGYGRARLL
jgi:hypothetical protein